jgi:hypothetical protein
LGREDLWKALDYAQSLEDNLASRKAVLSILWASLELGEEFLIDALPHFNIPDSDRNALIAQLVSQWPDSSAAFEWVNNNVKGATRGEMLGRCLRQLAMSSPEKSIAQLNNMGEGGERVTAGTFLFAGWASNSPQEALSLAHMVNDKIEKKILLDIAFAGLARIDPERAEQILSHWKKNNTQYNIPQESATTLAAHLALSKSRKEGSSEALAWAQTLPIELDVDASRVVLDNWSQRAPADAADAFEKMDSNRRVMLGESFITGWAQREPANAGKWLLSYPESAERVNMTANLVAIWGDTDPVASSSWLGILQEGDSRDAGIRRMIVRERSEDPESALLWAYEITDPKSRDSEVKVLQENYFKDPD